MNPSTSTFEIYAYIHRFCFPAIYLQLILLVLGEEKRFPDTCALAQGDKVIFWWQKALIMKPLMIGKQETPN